MFSQGVPHVSRSRPVRIPVIQGEARVSADPNVEFTTILGSCVATCLFDPVARIGGMNHFLLAEPAKSDGSTKIDEHYGVYLMELLINEMLGLGADKNRLKARLYGGANMQLKLRQIGSANAAFARSFLHNEGIELGYADLEGSSARRVNFKPASGKVRCLASSAAEAPKPEIPATQPPPEERGDIELF